MKKIILPLILLVSIVLSTIACILGSKVIEKTENSPPIYITYPKGYTDIPPDPIKVKASKSTKKKLAKP